MANRGLVVVGAFGAVVACFLVFFFAWYQPKARLDEYRLLGGDVTLESVTQHDVDTQRLARRAEQSRTATAGEKRTEDTGTKAGSQVSGDSGGADGGHMPPSDTASLCESAVKAALMCFEVSLPQATRQTDCAGIAQAALAEPRRSHGGDPNAKNMLELFEASCTAGCRAARGGMTKSDVTEQFYTRVDWCKNRGAARAADPPGNPTPSSSGAKVDRFSEAEAKLRAMETEYEATKHLMAPDQRAKMGEALRLTRQYLEKSR